VEQVLFLLVRVTQGVFGVFGFHFACDNGVLEEFGHGRGDMFGVGQTGLRGDFFVH
jgi:hypothetical protein